MSLRDLQLGSKDYFNDTLPQYQIEKSYINNETLLFRIYNKKIKKIILEMKSLVEKGRTIKWSNTLNWCYVGSHQFNINKEVWEYYVNNNFQFEY